MLLLPAGQVKAMRWVALIGSLIPFGLALLAWARFDSSSAAFQLTEQVPWYLSLNASYHVGVDGISLTMVLLTTFLMPLAFLTSFTITEKVRTYMALFLLLETAMLGVFVSLDLLLFFVFWEVGLVPMYFLIAQWGGKNRNYASLEIHPVHHGRLAGVAAGDPDDGRADRQLRPAGGDPEMADTGQASLFGLPLETVKAITFWAFVIAFAVKVPVWPFHTWLPDAHTEAPTAGSMILAGVLLKLGAYGFIRLVLPLFPHESQAFAPWLAALAVAAIVMGALGAWGQTDFKRLVAYSSINHMGFVVLAVAAAGAAARHAGCAYRHERRRAADGGARAVLGRHVLPGGRDLRAHAYPRPERAGRAVCEAAGLRLDPDLHRHGLARAAGAGRFRGRVPDRAGRLAGLHGWPRPSRWSGCSSPARISSRRSS